MDWQPHPGFGMLKLTRDGESPDWWDEFTDVHWWSYWLGQGWHTYEIKAGPHKGEIREAFDGDWYIGWAVDSVTLGEIEECVSEDPDHDWRLEIHGPMGGAVYQRHGCKQWVAVGRLDGFA